MAIEPQQEQELRRRIAHIRQEREQVDFMLKTAALMDRMLERGVDRERRQSMAENVALWVRINRELRTAAGEGPEEDELEGERALEDRIARLRNPASIR